MTEMRWAAAILLLGSFFSVRDAAGTALKVGEPAPRVSALSLGHGRITLSELRGHVVLINYWATWCASCVSKIPYLQELEEEYGPRGLRIIGISLDEDRQAVRRMIEEKNIGWPQVCDRKGTASPLAKAFQVTGTPRYFVIDAQGLLAGINLRAREIEDVLIRLLKPEKEEK